MAEFFFRQYLHIKKIKHIQLCLSVSEAIFSIITDININSAFRFWESIYDIYQTYTILASFLFYISLQEFHLTHRKYSDQNLVSVNPIIGYLHVHEVQGYFKHGKILLD